jgi:hypothetical protein
MLGPITTARARQLNQQMNPFLCSSIHEIKNRLLLNDIIVLRNEVKEHGGLIEHKNMMEDQGDVHNKLEAESNSTSSPTQSPEPVCSHIDAQCASEFRFGCSTYAWKSKKITITMTLVSYQNSPGIIEN